jgi:hypothetical protein
MLGVAPAYFLVHLLVDSIMKYTPFRQRQEVTVPNR